MRALIVYAHPNPKSFNHAILETAQEALRDGGAEVRVRDLYAEGWDPSLSAGDFESLLAGRVPDDIAREQEAVSWADTLLMVFPVWWFGPPAILKGWLDRVFSVNFAYRSTDHGLEGLLRGRRALVISTSGADEAAAGASGMIQSMRTSLVEGTLRMSGLAPVTYRNFYAVPFVSDADRHAMLDEVRRLVGGLSGMHPDVGRFGVLHEQPPGWSAAGAPPEHLPGPY
ncbi:MAG: NAD(P)H-dependent oxidoreductase [Thermoanaerobacterales bacterium]|nr:NAD(P)H-dependent oxidoreductase [Bacillota bacterium]MDI6906638.1 NAD(P)H-dependent oxidoreductase [Thermoanaerobacterales bacterium]